MSTRTLDGAGGGARRLVEEREPAESPLRDNFDDGVPNDEEQSERFEVQGSRYDNTHLGVTGMDERRLLRGLRRNGAGRERARVP